MASWFRGVLLVLCLAVLGWNGARADETNADNHACTYFRALDFDCDLKITKLDFIAMFTSVVKSGDFNVPFKLAQVTYLATQALKFFPLFDKNTVEAILENGVKFQEFRDSMKKRRNNKPEELKVSIIDMAHFFHNTFSTNSQTKSLSLNDFKAVYSAFRVPESAVAGGFADLDLNGDKNITVEECYTNAIPYFIYAPVEGRTNSWAGIPYSCDYVAAKTDCDSESFIDILLG